MTSQHPARTTAFAASQSVAPAAQAAPGRVTLEVPGQRFTLNDVEYTFIGFNGCNVTLADRLGQFDVPLRLDDEALLWLGGLA